MTLSVYETLAYVERLEGKDDKIAALRRMYKPALGIVLQYAYDPVIQWNLPEGDPPFTPTVYLDQQYALWQNVRKLHHFIKDSGSPVTKMKREQLFVQLLETVSPDDCKVLLAMKDKDLQRLFPNLTVELINEAFPGLINVVEKKRGRPKKEAAEATQDEQVETA